jgi:hypothetical protein
LTRYEFSHVPFRSSAFPIVPVQLSVSGGEWLATSALVDSGASISLFDGSIGEGLGLTVRSGKKIRPSGIGGSITAYVHRLRLKIGDEELDSDVAFTYKRRLPLNLLGRASVFERFKVTFVEMTRKTILETV